MSDDLAAAKTLLLTLNQGVLATHSHKFAGYPYGSVVPFCLDLNTLPLFLISELAQHTRNLRQNPHASLTVYSYAAADQLQAQPRLVLLGQVEFLTPDLAQELAGRYYRYLPSAPDYHLLQDFCFARLRPIKAHFIAGFGQIRWLEAAELELQKAFTPAQEQALVEELNTREPELLQAIWHKVSGLEAAESVSVRGLDSLGGDLRQAQQMLRFKFNQPAASLEAAWHQLHSGEVRALAPAASP